MCPLPNLVHPVPIRVQRENKASTFVDEDFREPVQQAARQTEFTVGGQVLWGRASNVAAGRGGPQEEYDGYILFRYVDLERLGQEIKRGDRFARIGKINTDVYVIYLLPCGHYGDQSGATMVKAYFRDRTPSRQSAGSL